MLDNDTRPNGEPLPGETRGERFLRIEDKSAPWECRRAMAGRGGDRIDAAMKVGLAWKREQLRLYAQMEAIGLTMCQAANSMFQIERQFKNEESKKWPLLQQTKAAETLTQSRKISTLRGA